MTAFTLGSAPSTMTVVLARGADFIASLTRSDGNEWEVGAVVELVIEGNTAWPATITGATAQWEVDETTVNTVIATAPKKARLFYTLGTAKTMWAIGPVIIR